MPNLAPKMAIVMYAISFKPFDLHFSPKVIGHKKKFKAYAISHQVPREFDPPTGMTYGFLPSLINFSFSKFVRACD